MYMVSVVKRTRLSKYVFLFIQMKDIHSTERLVEFSKRCSKEVSKAEVDEGKKNGTNQETIVIANNNNLSCSNVLKHFLLTFWNKLVCVHNLDDTNQTSILVLFSFYSLFRANTLLLATVIICIKIVSRITPNFYFKVLHSLSGIMLVGLNIGVNTPR